MNEEMCPAEHQHEREMKNGGSTTRRSQRSEVRAEAVCKTIFGKLGKNDNGAALTDKTIEFL